MYNEEIPSTTHGVKSGIVTDNIDNRSNLLLCYIKKDVINRKRT